ncbi:hypothetical protein THARTR1_06380 [Trichoderma harzianum]|uniref:Uncharacterized protein n=1 Tax=Trichoderma harzianum TaxID=5544 RepID=A0A2K0U5Y0_TRIHA|nr:hypothetical protein THARTR1_06380 [Trichoderma harzianum]
MMMTFIQQAQAQSDQSSAVLQQQNGGTNRHKLRSILEKEKRHVYIVIDAVDQLPKDERGELLKDLNTFREQSAEYRISIVISSRSRDECSFLPNYTMFEIEVKPDDTSSDIQRYLENRLQLSDLFREDPELKTLVLHDIANKSNGFFLWAKLQVETVVRMEFKISVKQHIKTSVGPKRMEEAYERYAAAFKTLPGVEKSVALRTIALLAYTTSSIPIDLLIATLNVNTCIKKDMKNAAEVKNSSQDLYKIVRRCSYLVEVDEKQGVFRFCHASAFEFFREYEPTQAHRLITELCLAYLCLPSFSQGYYEDAKWYNYGSLEPVLKMHPFLRYASCIWGGSYERSLFRYNERDSGNANTWNDESNEAILFFLGKLLGGSTEQKRTSNLQLSFQVYMLNLREEIPGNISHEHVISYFGLVGLLDFLKEAKEGGNYLDLQKVDEEGLSVIHWAIRKAAILKPAVDSMKSEISKAVDSMTSEIFKLLDTMRREISRDTNPMESGTSTIVDSVQREISQLVDSLESEVSNVVDSKIGEICKAVDSMKNGIFKVVDSENSEISNALKSKRKDISEIMESAEKEISKIVESTFNLLDSMDSEVSGVVGKLIMYGASTNVSDREGRTPLHYAARYGMSKVVELLETNNAELNKKDNRNQTALVTACKEHHEKVIAILVEAGADLWIQSSYGTALQILCLVGCCDCVELILRKYEAKDPLRRLYPLVESNVVAKSWLSRYHMRRLREGKGAFGTSLHAAAFHGRKDVVELLLKRGQFPVKATHYIYGSPLTAAAAGCNIIMKPKPYEEIFELLIAHGANVNDDKGTRGPALCAAASNGHKVLVELLLRNNAKDSSGKNSVDSAYQAAVKGNHDEIKRLLEDNGFKTTRTDDASEDKSKIESLLVADLRQEFFRVAFTVAHKGNIKDLIKKTEVLILRELEKPEPTTRLSIMLKASQEVFNDTIKLATKTASLGEQKVARKQTSSAKARNVRVSFLRERLRGFRRDHTQVAQAVNPPISQAIIAESSPARGELDSSPARSKQEYRHGGRAFRTFFLKRGKPLFNTDDIDFADTVDLMTKAGVAILEKAIETSNRNMNMKVKDDIACSWANALNNLLTSNADGESLLKTVINSRAVDFKAYLIDPKLSREDQLNKAVGLASVAIELILVTFRNPEHFKRLSVILADLYISAVNSVEDLGEHGSAAVRRLLQVVIQIFEDAVATKDPDKVRPAAEAGVEALKQLTLNPKKNLMDTCADEWVRQWEVMRKNGMIGVVHDMIKDRYQEYTTALEEERYDQALSLATVVLVLTRAAFEQDLTEVMKELMSVLEKGFGETMESFYVPLTANTMDSDQHLSQALERELSQERRHIYEAIVEGAFRLFAMAESKGSNYLEELARKIVDGIQKTPRQMREKLDEVIASRVQIAKNGANLKPREIALAARYFINLVRNAGDADMEQFASWLKARMAEHEWLVRFEGDVMKDIHQSEGTFEFVIQP